MRLSETVQKSLKRALSSSKAIRRPTATTRVARHSTATGSLMDMDAGSVIIREPAPSRQALQTLFVSSAIPMIGFGFMDNFVMIQAGQYIDSTLGVQLGLATMTAAAAGQVVSDVSGVLFGGTLERVLGQRIAAPALTSAQRKMSICRNVALLGAVVGVVVGCALGAMTLLVVDLEARDRIQRARQLRQAVSDMMEGQACTVYLASNKTYTLDSRDNALQRTRLEFLSNANGSALRCAREQQAFRHESENRMYAPVTIDGEVQAVIEYQRTSDEEPFDGRDLASANLTAKHLAIMMKHMD